MTGKAVSALARAKINLFLHIVGRRPDGYHLLESLVVFAETGDRVSAEPSPMLSLSLDGPFAISLDSGGDNLVLRAALILQEWAREQGFAAPGAAMHLDKRLPVASGIGGGSADAAAALTVLKQLWKLEPDGKTLLELALKLGADVPVCLDSRNRMMSGIGEILSQPPGVPRGWMVLANPMRSVDTGAVYGAFDEASKHPRNSGKSGRIPAPNNFGTIRELSDWLAGHTRNDLQGPALKLVPEIGAVLEALADCDGIMLSRMSGSGATCFGLCETRGEALTAERTLRAAHSDWWIEAAAISR